MRKILVCLVLAAFTFGWVSASSADEVKGSPVTKLGRGIANVVTCPLELFAGMKKGADEHGVVGSLTTGVLYGICGTVKRLAVGAYETVTFPVPLPSGYKPILTNPEYEWEHGLNIPVDRPDF
ncbi:MAG: exosortase system-associated protein, TIGR04073 family [Candidatus Omnitrophica bacterium]|nr:exosortase system-associated protein, TIGR04073 family [Candidatus Omnitrophota bacterium]